MKACLIERPETRVGRWAGMDCALAACEDEAPQKLSRGKAREPACSAELRSPGAHER
jgi:hypothetical protein